MNRRVILVDLYWTRDKDPRVPLGHASIAAALQDAGVQVTSVVRAVNQGPPGIVLASELAREIADLARTSGPDTIVAIGAYVWAEEIVQLLLPSLRAYGFSGDIVLGGPQISYSGAGLEEIYPDADMFVRGYGEHALVELARRSTNPIAGVHLAGTEDRVEQASVDLSKLPSPFLDGRISLKQQRFVRWETQRGCPYRCSFCQHREAGARLKRTDLELGRLRDEIAAFVEAGVEQIAVLDPIFNIGANAGPVLREFVAQGYRGKLSLQCRAEQITEEFLDLTVQLDVCLEFGLQTIHKTESKAVNRANTMRAVDKALAAVRERRLRHEVSLIFGLPEQTRESFYETVRWCIERDVPVIKAFPLLLLRGTSLEKEREAHGFETTHQPMGMVVASNTFNREDWAAMACLSEGLKATEGNHPRWEELLELAERMQPDVSRWVASLQGF